MLPAVSLGALLGALLAAPCGGLAVSAARRWLRRSSGATPACTTVYEDTLPDLAHRYSLGYYEIIRANPGVDVWIPGADKEIVLPGRRILPPGPREGIVVNLPEHRLYYYPKPNGHDKPVVITYPVSIGKMDWRTPARGDARHRQDQTPRLVSAGVGAQGARGERRPAAEDGAGRSRTIRSGTSPCGSPPATAPT